MPADWVWDAKEAMREKQLAARLRAEEAAKAHAAETAKVAQAAAPVTSASSFKASNETEASVIGWLNDVVSGWVATSNRQPSTQVASEAKVPAYIDQYEGRAYKGNRQ